MTRPDFHFALRLPPLKVPGRGLVLALFTMAVALGAGCSGQEIERAVYAGGKIAYDSFKTSNQPQRP